MKLFQQHEVNPLAGCLPLIVQMPIFIALYNSIYMNENIREHTFLWLQLGEKDHLLYLADYCAAITTFIQSKMMQSQQKAMPAMQGIMMIFPVLIFVMAYHFQRHFRFTGFTVIFTRLFRTISCTFATHKGKESVPAK